jgi:integrase/recombinase XerD
MKFTNYLQSQGKSKSTVKCYQYYICDFLAWLDADNTEAEQVTTKDLMSYLNHLQQKGQENKTRSFRLNAISHFFDYQIQLNYRNDNPAKHIKIRGTKQKKLYPTLSQQDLEKIYTSYEVPEENDSRNNRNWFTAYKLSKQRNKIIIGLMINQALTTIEVNRIEINDLKLREGEIYIKGSRKSNERTLKLKSHQIMDLMEYKFTVRNEFLKYQEFESNLLFLGVPTLGKTQARGEGNLQIWKALSKEIKAQNPKFINFKQVRTSIISRWLKQYNLREVQYMAGHRFISSTESYFSNQMEDLQFDIDKFHPLG